MMRASSRPKPLGSSRLIICASVLGYYVSRFLRPFLLPCGPAQPSPSMDRPRIPSVDFSNDTLTVKHGKLKKVFERVPDGQEPLLKGPETVIIRKDGALYVMSQDSLLLQLQDLQEQEDGVSILANVVEVMDLGIGRPLGGTFADDGSLYIADSILGLTRVKNPHDPASKLELIASRVKVEGHWSPILLADDVVVGKQSGKVYFSDATDIAPDRIGTHWDVIYASKLDLIRGGRRRGRIIEYDPSTEDVRVLVDGIHFANGMAVDRDERFIIVAESFQARSLKYYLKGPKKGILEPIDTFFPGFTDGVDCSHDSGLCYVAVPTTPGVMSFVWSLPSPIDRYVRTFLMMLPRAIAPKPPPFAAIVEIDPGDEIQEQRVVRTSVDPKGEDVPLLTGVTVRGSKVYMGFIDKAFVGVYDISE